MRKSKDKAVDAAVAKVAPGFAADEMKWRADDAMRDIARVEEHKKNKPLMKAVKKKAADLNKAVANCK